MIGENAGQNGVAQAPDAYRPTTVPELRRRTFLKLLGLATLPIVTGLPLFDRAAWPDQDHTAGMPTHLADHARALLQPVIAELQAQGFPFDLDQSILVQLAQQPHLLGLMLRDTRLPPRHDGADIALTLNLHAPERSTLTYLVGRSDTAGLELRQVIVEAGGQQQRQIRLAREAGMLEQHAPVYAAHRMVYQAAGPAAAEHVHESLWLEQTQVYQSASPSVAEHGHASPLWLEQTHWYYNHAGGALWFEASRSEGTADRELRFTTCEEYRNNRIRSAPGAHRFHRRYGETRTVSLEQASLSPAFVCAVGPA